MAAAGAANGAGGTSGVSPALWQRIESSLAAQEKRAATANVATTLQPETISSWWNSLRLWVFAATGFAAAAFMGIVVVGKPPQPPGPGYMVVLVGPQDKSPGWVVQAATNSQQQARSFPWQGGCAIR